MRGNQIPRRRAIKVLFLDIDGVLNCESTRERLGEGFGIYAAFMGIDLRLLDLLKRWLIEHPDVNVVLSSSWRLDKRMAEEVQRQGIEYIDMTADLGQRGKEIDDWLSRHVVTHYAILDDIQQFRGHQQPHFVQTSYIHGLRQKNLDKVASILELENPLSPHQKQARDRPPIRQ